MTSPTNSEFTWVSKDQASTLKEMYSMQCEVCKKSLDQRVEHTALTRLREHSVAQMQPGGEDSRFVGHRAKKDFSGFAHARWHGWCVECFVTIWEGVKHQVEKSCPVDGCSTPLIERQNLFVESLVNGTVEQWISYYRRNYVVASPELLPQSPDSDASSFAFSLRSGLNEDAVILALRDLSQNGQIFGTPGAPKNRKRPTGVGDDNGEGSLADSPLFVSVTISSSPPGYVALAGDDRATPDVRDARVGSRKKFYRGMACIACLAACILIPLGATGNLG